MTTEYSVEIALSRVSELSRQLGSQQIAIEAADLAQRVTEGRFYVACVGQFKRGKSTLLNALLEDSLLPTGVLPVTAVPTVVRYGRVRSARIRFRDGSLKGIAPEELRDYVSEDRNPENRKGVLAAEVFSPNQLLVQGMCFVDTPGLGSIFASNATVTRKFIPHIDAAIAVLGADPPIGGDELKLIEEVGEQIRDIIIVLNKADKTSAADRDVAAAFTREVLERRLRRPIGAIYQVSAQQWLERKTLHPDWQQFTSALESLARESGQVLVQAAAERGLRRFSEALMAIVSEEREALLRPIRESEERIKRLFHTCDEADRSLSDLGYLFTAEERRLSDMFRERRQTFLTHVSSQVDTEFRAKIQMIQHSFGPRFRRHAFEAAQKVAEHYIAPWLRAEQQLAEAEYRKVESRFVDIGNEFLKKLSESGVEELARMPNALASAHGFRARSQFTFEGLIHVARPASPLRYMADVVLGAIGSSSVIERDARKFLHHLMETNSARVQSDIVRRVQDSRSRLEAEIRTLLREVGRIAETALGNARTCQAEGVSAVSAALARLDRIGGEVRAAIGGAGLQ